MSLRERRPGAFQVDDAVRRALAAWSRERDPDLKAWALRRASERLGAAQRQALIERLAEISLGALAVIERAPPDGG